MKICIAVPKNGLWKTSPNPITGVPGNAAFDPGSGNSFFLIVANDGVKEGSYGTNSTDDQRPEDVGTPVCDRERDLDGVVCE
jgi:hypothetical protein